MRLEYLNWMDVQSYLEKDDRLMIVWGACEQHAYLSLLTDVKIPLALADAASKHTGILVAPTVNFGASAYFLEYPGTLSLRIDTLLRVAEDLLRSAYIQGFRRFLFLNGHAGNDPVRGLLYEFANEFSDARLRWYSWWDSHSVADVCTEIGLKPGHGNWLEAFPFTRVADLPQSAKEPPNVAGLLSASMARKTYGDGSFGGPYVVDLDIYSRIFQAALSDVLVQLEF